MDSTSASQRQADQRHKLLTGLSIGALSLSKIKKNIEREDILGRTNRQLGNLL